MSSAPRIPGTVYKLANGFAVDAVSTPQVDRQKMRVDAIICTPAIDRQGEIIIPSGVQSANYQKNPIVLWDHGFNPTISTPIAKSQHPDGSLAVKIGQDAIEASAYFTDKSPESYQIFGLIEEGIIRGTSIHVMPLATRDEFADGDRVHVIHESDLLEWSFGAIPVNPESVAKVLSVGKIGNEKLLDSIAKTLRPFAPLAKGNGIGWRPDTEGKPPVTTATKPKTMTPEEEEAARQATEAAKAGAGAGSGNGEPGEGDANDQTGGDDQPPSVRVANATKAALSQLVANLESAANMYEDPRAKEYFAGSFMEQCKAMMTEVDGLISELGGKTEEAAKPDESESEEAMKTFLASGQSQRLRALGVLSPLADLAKAKNLTSAQRIALESACKSFRGMVSSARTVADESKSKAIQQQVTALKSQNDELGKSLADLNKTMNEILPASA